MKNSPKILGIIPARGGSKGIKNKNIIDIKGKPLISWTIEAAHKSSVINKTIVSSDSEDIISVARKLGCDAIKRPPNLANDDTPSIDVVLHALELCKGFDYIILLQPTSPLRDYKEIDQAYSKMINLKAESCVSLCAVDKSPYWMYQVDKTSYRLTNVMSKNNKYLRRQDTPEVHILNGAIYISEVSLILKTKKLVSDKTIGYIMPQYKSIDIDSIKDLNYFKSLL